MSDLDVRAALRALQRHGISGLDGADLAWIFEAAAVEQVRRDIGGDLSRAVEVRAVVAPVRGDLAMVNCARVAYPLPEETP